MNLLAQDLAGLSSAEDFLTFLDVAYDPAIVAICRLHILKRFHTYLDALKGLEEMSVQERRTLYREQLTHAYTDFVHSSARAEKVFPVFRRQDNAFVALSAIRLVSRTQN